MVRPDDSRRPPRRQRPLLAVLVVVVLGAVLAACQDGASEVIPTASDSANASPLAWSEHPLPDGMDAVTLAAAGDSLVIGAWAPDRPNPRLLVLRDGRLTEVDVDGKTPYAAVARWLSLATRDGQVVAVGGARGGAHANVRWTIWAGDLGSQPPRLVEQPQPFGVFGGWGAGDLTGIAFAGTEPVVAGAWQSNRTGNDVSLWFRSGNRWERQDSTGSPLGSTPRALNGARFVTSAGDGLALAGSVTDLGTGSIASVPALWTAPGGHGPWTLVRLPASQPIAEAHAARCDGAACLVVGTDGGTLAVWTVQGSTVSRATTPALGVSDKQTVPAPVRVRGEDLVMVPGAVLQRGSSGWRQRSAPPGVPIATATVDDTLYVATTDRDGKGRLWSARP
ncbi:hypothetical protein [Intrasporangium sp.]|uniref:hypothetical protein n=1 Tax=Intrasporangium sp. TaxID=1925024 RepID=UPI0033654009